MKVTNETSWQTSDLKKIFIECCKTKLDSWKNLKVEVTYSRSRWIHGRASYGGGLYDNGGRIKIFLPRNPVDKEFIDTRWKWTEPKPYAYLNFKRMLAWVFMHELFHTLSKRHREMRGNYYYKWKSYVHDPEKMSWADNLLLRQKEVKTKPKPNLQMIRYEHVLETLKTKKSQLKRLQNQIKKWNDKRKYYESVLVASGKIEKEDSINER